MISASTIDIPIHPEIFSQKKQSSFLPSSQKILDVAYEKFWVPACAGFQWGAIAFTCETALETVLTWIPGLADAFTDPAAGDEYMKEVLGNFQGTVLWGPLIEEIVFRGICQSCLMEIAEGVLPDKDVKIFSHTIKLSALVAIVATSILFGLAHLSSGLGILHVVMATFGGIVMGLLKHHYGLTASAAAHVTNNGICYALLSCGG